MNLKKYPEARANFLKCTDRNEVFPGFLKRIFKYSSFQSLLDINAGDDSSAMFLSKMVTKYVPVDSIAEASCFRNGTFNVVIVQSLPTAIESRMLLTEEVRRLIADGGRLIVMTLNGEHGRWHDLLIESDLDQLSEEYKPETPRVFLGRNFGTAVEERVLTHIESSNMGEVQKALAFVYSDKDERRFDRFMSSRGAYDYLIREFWRDERSGLIRFPLEYNWFVIIR